MAVAEMRFIPACAGNASGQPSAILICPVHPRMRGERRKRSRRRKPDTGSSPHARGTPSPTTAVTCRNRFIPACAGNALTRAAFLTNDTVHPRMRGERGECSDCLIGATGSSPHARGTLKHSWSRCRKARFIPACAGNANPRPIIWRHKTVHPRMRGERDRPNVFQRTELRFIPACAGNATYIPMLVFLGSVHPRMRGERPWPMTRWCSSAGSSPHARGTRGLVGRQRRGYRFIPACAGNACMRHSTPITSAVHPRMRGERTSVVSLPCSAIGSSPHARGTLHQRAVQGRRPRFIPACAGNA